MPRKSTPLTVMEVKKAKPMLDKDYCLYDQKGGYLLVASTGSKIWKLKYRLNGKERRCTLGRYPEMSLEEFRTAVSHFRKQISDGIDVISERENKRVITKINDLSQNLSFEKLANEWFVSQKAKAGFSDSHLKDIRQKMHAYIFPRFANLPIDQIKRVDAIALVKKIEELGHFATLKKVVSIARQIFSYAIAMEYIENNPFGDIHAIMQKRPPEQHFPTITDPFLIGDLMRRIDSYVGTTPIVRAETLFSIYTLARQIEARHARWNQVDFEKKTWTISAEDMKARREHVVPLSSGAMDILKQMENIKSSDSLIFPSQRVGRPLSDNASRMLLRTLGYANEELVPHGFRAMGSTALNELGYPRDLIDLALAHTVGGKVSQAYNHSIQLEARREMLENWYLYLIALKNFITPEQARDLYRFRH